MHGGSVTMSGQGMCSSAGRHVGVMMAMSLGTTTAPAKVLGFIGLIAFFLGKVEILNVTPTLTNLRQNT